MIEGFRILAAEMLWEKIGNNILNNKLYIEIHLVPDPVFVAHKVLAFQPKEENLTLALNFDFFVPDY